MTAAREQRESKTGSQPVQRQEGDAKAPAAAPGSLKSGLRTASFAEGEAMLTPPGAPPSGPKDASAAPVQRKAAGAVQRDESIADRVPANVDLRSASIAFTLPAGRKLAGSTLMYNATTRYATTITVTASPHELRVSVSPSLPFDVTFPAANMNFYGAGIHFADAQPYAEFHKSGVGFDVTATGRETVVGLLNRAIAGTAMSRPGYDPLSDRDLMSTLARVKANFDSLPEAASGGGAGVGAADISQPTIGATLAMRTPFHQESGGAGVRINAGGQLAVEVNGTGNLSRILAAGNPQAAAMAAGIRDVNVRSESIELLKDGEPCAKLQRLRIARGGAVTLEQFEMLGGLGAGAGFESLFRILAGGVALAGRGVPIEVGMEATARSGAAEPELVRGMSRTMIEQGLTSAVQGLLRDNRNAIPGIDLGLVFGAGG